MSLLLILLVLSPPVHACNARILKVDTKSSTALFDVSSKGFEVASLKETSVPVMEAVPSPRGIVPGADTIQGGAEATNGELVIRSEKQIEDADDHEKTPSRMLPAVAVRDPSVLDKDVVSWRVPGDGTTRGDPRFDVDYVGPRTHPPSHN